MCSNSIIFVGVRKRLVGKQAQKRAAVAAEAMMEVDAELRCSFWVLKPAVARLEASGLLAQSGAAFEQEEAAEERFRPPTPPKRPG